MDATTVRLTDLHDRYVGTLHRAVGRGASPALLDELADDYTEAALTLLTEELQGRSAA